MMAGEGHSEEACFSRICRAHSTILASVMDPFRLEKSIPIAARPQSTASYGLGPSADSDEGGSHRRLTCRRR